MVSDTKQDVKPFPCNPPFRGMWGSAQLDCTKQLHYKCSNRGQRSLGFGRPCQTTVASMSLSCLAGVVGLASGLGVDAFGAAVGAGCGEGQLSADPGNWGDATRTASNHITRLLYGPLPCPQYPGVEYAGTQVQRVRDR